jgi:hypothetical protein
VELPRRHRSSSCCGSRTHLISSRQLCYRCGARSSVRESELDFAVCVRLCVSHGQRTSCRAATAPPFQVCDMSGIQRSWHRTSIVCFKIFMCHKSSLRVTKCVQNSKARLTALQHTFLLSQIHSSFLSYPFTGNRTGADRNLLQCGCYCVSVCLPARSATFCQLHQTWQSHDVWGMQHARQMSVATERYFRDFYNQCLLRDPRAEGRGGVTVSRSDGVDWLGLQRDVDKINYLTPARNKTVNLPANILSCGGWCYELL